MTLLLTNLELSFIQNLQDDVVDECLGAKRFCQILGRRSLTFADGEEDIRNLKDVIQVPLAIGVSGVSKTVTPGER